MEKISKGYLLGQPPPPGRATSQTMLAFPVSEEPPVSATCDLVSESVHSPSKPSLSFLEDHYIHSIGLWKEPDESNPSLIHAETRKTWSFLTSSLIGETDMTPNL